jgi:AraC-like DNA-binding protein
MKLVVEKPSPLAVTELVACEVVRGRDFGCVWHHHPECEITLVLRGGTERFVGDRLAPLVAGDLVVLGSDVPHDWRNQPVGGKRAARVEAIVVQFMPHLLGEDWLKRASMQPLRRLFERSRRGLHVTGHTRDAAERILRRIVKAHGVRRVILLLELLELLAASRQLKEISSEGFQAEPTAQSSDRIGRACAHIESHLAGSIYVSELARMAGLSGSGFSRLFKKCTGRTVPQYVNELRIAHAGRLLAETDQTVNQISLACGFVSPAHFQRQFQRHQKRPPLDYRAAVRQSAK